MIAQCTVGELLIIGVLVLAVDDQPGWNMYPQAVKVLKWKVPYLFLDMW